jgi:hypothetical protein
MSRVYEDCEAVVEELWLWSQEVPVAGEARKKVDREEVLEG